VELDFCIDQDFDYANHEIDELAASAVATFPARLYVWHNGYKTLLNSVNITWQSEYVRQELCFFSFSQQNISYTTFQNSLIGQGFVLWPAWLTQSGSNQPYIAGGYSNQLVSGNIGIFKRPTGTYSQNLYHDDCVKSQIPVWWNNIDHCNVSSGEEWFAGVLGGPNTGGAIHIFTPDVISMEDEKESSVSLLFGDYALATIYDPWDPDVSYEVFTGPDDVLEKIKAAILPDDPDRVGFTSQIE
jgi:hypothetical protein